MRHATLPILVGIVAVISADVLDYGDMNQYESKVKNPPSLGGESVWLSGTENEGFDILLSQNTQSKVGEVLQGCGTDPNQCINGIMDTLQAATVELDSKLDRRHFGHLLSKTIKGNWEVFVTISEMLYLNWVQKSDKMDNSGMFLPAKLAAEAAQAASATSVVLSAGGSAVATITPPPEPKATLTGSVAPEFTTLTKDENSHKKGDLVAIMDEELAQKLNDLIGMTADCDDGLKFDAEHPGKKRASATMGHAVCAAERIISNSGKEAPFGDIAMLKHDQMSVMIKENAGKAKDAFVLIKDFVIAYGPLVAIPDEVIEQVAVYVAAIVMNAVVEGIAIGGQTLLATDIWIANSNPSRTDPTTTSKTGCPDPTKTPLFCGYEGGEDCPAQMPKKKNQQEKVVGPICKDGEFKECPCNTPSDDVRFVMSEEMAKDQIFFLELFEDMNDGDDTDMQCSEEFSRVTINYWKSLYPKFCEELKQNPRRELNKTYFHDEIKPQKRSYPVDKRSPPADPNNYNGLQFGFGWSGGDCPTSCEDIYENLAQADCGGSASVMRASGYADLGCGSYSYSIGQSSELKTTCRRHPLQAPRGDRESNGAVSLDRAIEQFCTDNHFKSVKKNENVYQRYDITEYGIPRRSSFWLRGAITCGEEEKMIKDDCITALKDGMEKCDSGSGFSHGLATSIGCLDYSIDLSGVTKDDSPPWDEKPSFPAPEFVPKPGGGANQVICSTGQKGDSIPDEDLDKALGAFCKDGDEIQGFGEYWSKMFNYPPKDQPRFNGNMILAIGAILNGDGNAKNNDKNKWKPYEDMRWCDNYDWKIGKEDCTFALRKIYKTCSNDNSLQGGDFVYRCVHYKTWPAF